TTRELLAAAKPRYSAGGSKKVKLGKARTQIAGSRAVIRIMSREVPPPLIALDEIWQADEEQQLLDGSRSIGDALCGTETKPGIGKGAPAPGSGPARPPG